MACIIHPVAGLSPLPFELQSEADASVCPPLALVGNKIPQRIHSHSHGVPCPHFIFHGLHHMRVRTDDNVRPSGVEETGEPFLLPVGEGVVLDAPVHEGDDVGGSVQTGFFNLPCDVERVYHADYLPFPRRQPVGPVSITEQGDFELPVADVQRASRNPRCRVGIRAR